MAWSKGKRIPTNLIIGFFGSGKTSAIAKLINQRPAGEKWSILINEFGEVSIDHAMVESNQEEIAVGELGAAVPVARSRLSSALCWLSSFVKRNRTA